MSSTSRAKTKAIVHLFIFHSYLRRDRRASGMRRRNSWIERVLVGVGRTQVHGNIYFSPNICLKWEAYFETKKYALVLYIASL